MADKKISQFPLLNAISASTIIPVVHDGTTFRHNASSFAVYASQWSAKTGSSNTFTGNQTINGNLTLSGNGVIGGNLEVGGMITAQQYNVTYVSSSVQYQSGSTEFGDTADDTHTFTGTVIINGLAVNIPSLMAQTASQDSVNFRISSTTGSINTTTASFDSVFLRISSTTGSINAQSSSQDLVNRGISSVTGSINTTTASFNSVFLGISSVTGALNQFTQSLNSISGSFATTGSNTFIGNQNITGSLSISAGEFNVTTGSGNMTSSLIFDHTQNDGVTLGLRHNDRLSFADHTFNTQVWAGGVYTQFVRNGTPYSILNVEAFDDNKIYLYRDTRLLNKSLVIDNNLTVQKEVVIGTGSLSIQRGQFSVTSGSGDLTSSVSFKPVDYDLVQGASVFEVRHINNIYPEELALKLSVSDTSGTLFFEKNGSVYNVLSVGGSSNNLFVSRNTRLLGTGLTVDDSLLVKGVITGSILATNGVVSSSNQLFELNGQTGSQDLVNLGISTFTGSIRAEIGGIEEYTASLKAAAIVSSSTQISNYYKFAETASANTFYGAINVLNSLTASLPEGYVWGGSVNNVSVLVATGSIVSQSAIANLGTTLYSNRPLTTNFSTVGSIFLGSGAGQNATNAQSSVFLGVQAGIDATNAQESFFVGNGAGAYSTNALRSNFIGISAGASSTGASLSNIIGYGAGGLATNATNANFLGNFTGYNGKNASYSTLIGYYVGSNVNGPGNGIGTNNIIIGTSITLENDRRDSINLGGIIFATGSYYSTSTTPYSGSVGNGRVGINKVLPQFSLDISGSVGVSGSFNLTGSANLTGSVVINQLTYPTFGFPDGQHGVEVPTLGVNNVFTMEIPKTVYEYVKNNSGATLLKGTPVHANDVVGFNSMVIAASASNAATMPATYILAQDLDDQEEGLGIAIGHIQGVNTTGLQAGQAVYVGANGGWTQTKPTGSNLIQNLGIVTKVGVNGGGVVLGAGRSNDVPNIQQGYFWVGNSGSVATAFPTSSFELSGRGIVSSSTQIQNYDVFSLNSNLYESTGSIKAEIAGIEAYTASLKGAIEVSGQNVNVLGMITAQQFNVTYVSSSVLFQSGSTKNGNTPDDRHEFTGSALFSSSISAPAIYITNRAGSAVYENQSFNSTESSVTNRIYSGFADVATNGGKIRLDFVGGDRNTSLIKIDVAGSWLASNSANRHFSMIFNTQPFTNNSGDTEFVTVPTSLLATNISTANVSASFQGGFKYRIDIANPLTDVGETARMWYKVEVVGSHYLSSSVVI